MYDSRKSEKQFCCQTIYHYCKKTPIILVVIFGANDVEIIGKYVYGWSIVLKIRNNEIVEESKKNPLF